MNYKDALSEVCFTYALKNKTLPKEEIYRKLDEVSSIEIINEPTRAKLTNIGNTCAIDSVMVALFSHFKELGHNIEYKNETKKKIVDWIDKINVKESIQDLVVLFKAFKSEDNFNIIGEPKDAIEFLIYFIKIFSDEIKSTKIFRTIKNGNVTYTTIDRSSSPIQYVPANVVASLPSINIRDLLVNKNTIDTSNLTTEEIVQSDIVIFAIGRKNFDGTFIATRVNATPTITTPNGDRFFLGAIVVIQGGHYVSYIRDINSWYLYDDNAVVKNTEVGTYSYLMNTAEPSPATNGVLYFYFPNYSSVGENILSTWNDSTTLSIGVFADELTDKLLTIHSKFNTVNVTSKLPCLKKDLEKFGGTPCLNIYDIKTYLYNLKYVLFR